MCYWKYYNGDEEDEDSVSEWECEAERLDYMKDWGEYVGGFEDI